MAIVKFVALATDSKKSQTLWQEKEIWWLDDCALSGAARLSGLRLFLVIYQILQVPTPILFLFQTFKQGFEIAFAEALTAPSANDLKE